jgi:hypothetical protein
MTAFADSVDRLVNQVAHWEQARWWSRVNPAGAGASPGAVPATRGDLVYALVQRLADLGAEAERRATRPVPRLGDLTLPDQLRVLADDLLAADPPPEDLLKTAAADVDAVRHALS